MMMLGMALLWATVIGLALLGFRWLFPGTRREEMPGSAENPLHILAQRYARGEIDQGEYRLMRRDIVAAAEVGAVGDDEPQSDEVGSPRAA